MKKFQKKKFEKIARRRINELFEEADKHKDKRLSNRYVQLARNISMKYNVPIPKDLRKRYCKHCYSYLKPGINLRIRRTEKGMTYSCLECNKRMRFPYN